MAGGSGTRFWPLSRQSHPKQFLPIGGKQPLLRTTAERILPLCGWDNLWVVASGLHARHIHRILPEMPRRNLVLEPRPRNTAPAIGLAAAVLRERDPEAVVVVLPSDHIIKPPGKFRTIIRTACREARSGETRIFEHALIMPFPKGRIRIEVSVRDRRSGTFRPLLQRTVDPVPTRVHEDNPHAGLEGVKIRYSGPPARMLDLVFLGDGYRAEETEAFLRAAREAADEILSCSPFKENADRINFWAVACPSRDSGVDEPLKGVYRSTPFDTSFNTFDLPRYALATRVHALFEAAGNAPCDLPILLFNSRRFGGGGLYNLYAMVSGSTHRASGVLVHELGHALGGLADEYYTSRISYVDFYPDGVEPWEPNITACLPGVGPKWASLLSPDVPVPTPDSARYDDVTGCFEGAGYRARGLFRPCRDCIMKSCRNGFCPVCSRALVRALRRFAP